LLKESDSRTPLGTEPLLRVSQYSGVTKRGFIGDTGEQDTRANSLLGYKLVAKDSLVINIMLAWNGSLGISPFDGITSPAYCVYRIAPGTNTWYIHHLMKTEAFRGQIKTASKGIVDSRLRLYTEALFDLDFLIPPSIEQDKIACFVRYIDLHANKLIKAKRRLIELLDERKQALIHKAVTRGLDPSVKMKDSGIDWLGEIPRHWDLTRNSRVFSEQKLLGDADLPLLEVSLRSGVRLASELDHFGRPRKELSHRSKYQTAKAGDIAYNMMRMWQGAVGVVPQDGLVSPAYVVAKPTSDLNSSFAYLLFRTPQYMGLVNRSSKGIVPDRNRLYWDDFKQLPIWMPPLAEQLLIVSTVSQETNAANLAITKTQSEIDLIREYRARLVADVVTGQLDVRGLELSDIEEDIQEPSLDSDDPKEDLESELHEAPE